MFDHLTALNKIALGLVVASPFSFSRQADFPSKVSDTRFRLAFSAERGASCAVFLQYPGGVHEILLMNEAKAKKIKSRVNRISGQIGGIGRMIDDDRYCLDILDQIAAVRSALDALGVELLTNHIECCVVGHGTGSEHEDAKPRSQEELLEEVRVTLGRFLK